jgi:REG-2-like HAD superfamily hydrolase
MPNRYDVITFDMGLTLVGMESFEDILMRMCRQRGIATSADRLGAAVSQVWSKVMADDARENYQATAEASRAWWRQVNLDTLQAAGIPGSDHEDMEQEFMAEVDDPANYAVFPDTLPTLQALRVHGYRLGVISNWGWNLPDMCDAWGLTPLVDFIVVSAREGVAKPNPAIFRSALRRAGSRPGAMLHVGDSAYADVGGARACGMDAVLISRKPLTRTVDCPAISDLRDLLPLLCLPPIA